MSILKQIKENFINKKNLKRALLLIILIMIVGLVLGTQEAKSEVKTLQERITELEEDLTRVQNDWQSIDERQTLYNDYCNQQKSLKEAEASFIRAQIEDMKYQKNVLEFGRGVEKVAVDFQ